MTHLELHHRAQTSYRNVMKYNNKCCREHANFLLRFFSLFSKRNQEESTMPSFCYSFASFSHTRQKLWMLLPSYGTKLCVSTWSLTLFRRRHLPTSLLRRSLRCARLPCGLSVQLSLVQSQVLRVCWSRYKMSYNISMTRCWSMDSVTASCNSIPSLR